MRALGWFYVITVLAVLAFARVVAQVPVQVSQTIETYEGKAYYLHTVEAQQTLYSIAKAYGVTVETILLNNPEARRGLRVNQVIRIPASNTPQQTQQAQAKNQPAVAGNNEAGEFEYIYHVAGKGETFAYVASVYMVPERRIRDANPNRTEPFREGDYILIPITRKDKRPPVNESPQLRRSGFDPYDTPAQRQQSGPTRRDLVNAANTSSAPQPSSSASSRPVASTTSSASENRQLQSAANTTAPVSPPQAGRTNQQQTSPVMPQNAQNEAQAYESAVPTRHIVRPQETLYSIAKQYNLTTAQLQQANPGLGENIQVGQVLLLPTSAAPAQYPQQAAPVSQDEMIVHTVTRGETLFRISRNYGVTIEELKRYNPGLSENLATGQQIRVPKKKITQSYLIHQVDKQQKTKQLARDYGLTTEELQKANPSIGKNVFPRQEVKIPLQTKPLPESKPIARGQEPLMPEPPKKKEKDELAAKPEQKEANDAATEECSSNPANERAVYKVALLLPLYLSEVPNTLRFTSRSLAADAPRGLSFLQFYQGFLMAADSLAEHFGLKAELIVLDVDQSQASVQKALSDPRLKQVNLIIGPFFSQAFDQAASFARENHIPIVNPVTLRHQVIDGNPWVIKLKPDQASLFTQLANTLTRTYPEAGVIVLHAPGRNQQEAGQIVEAFENVIRKRPRISNSDLIRALSARSSGPAFIQSGDRYIDLTELRLRPLDSTVIERRVSRLAFDRNDLSRFRELADTWRNNIVVVYSDDRAYAMDVLNRLNQVADDYTIQLVGLPEWRKFDNLFTEHMVRLNLHLADAGYLNYDDLKVQFFVSQYRNRFGIEPNNYAFEGFDTGWYFLQMLQRNGKDFLPCLPKYSISQMNNSFRFDRSSPNDGFENQNWNISRIKNYKFELIENKD